MNIAIFGGRFDPPHLGHLLVAQQTLEKVNHLDEVWLMPAKTHPWRKMEAGPTDRLAMTELLVSPSKRIRASDFDVKRGGETFTIDTVKLVKEKGEADRLFWLLGSDALHDFHRWRDYKKLQESISFIVFPRGDSSVDNLPQNFQLVENEDLLVTNFSSTTIRKRANEGMPISALVPTPVEEYIKKHHLYK